MIPRKPVLIPRRALQLLAEHPAGLALQAIVDSGGYDKRRTRRLLERMEMQGLVDRGYRTNFGRRRGWRLTEAGRRAAAPDN